jgi:hypothetical protein
MLGTHSSASPVTMHGNKGNGVITRRNLLYVHITRRIAVVCGRTGMDIVALHNALGWIVALDTGVVSTHCYKWVTLTLSLLPWFYQCISNV